MEAFRVFATFSLIDLMSGPLGMIRQNINHTNKDVNSLSERFGKLAMSMAPLAIAGGVVLGAFGKCVATAAGFEDQMAKVGAVSRATAAELRQLDNKARELGASTQFSASQVAQAEQYLAMAGFKTHENLAALPAVLNLAAATATDLGRAADISSDIMGAFGMKAEKMTRVADVLAMTCATANTDMEKLGDTMKYVAPVARTAGLSIEETAAMAGLLGNVGIKASQAGTTLKAMLNKLAAPASEGAKALKKLGISTKDAAGNLRSPVQVLGELSGKLKKLGTAEQMEAMKKIVGEEAVAGFAELIKKGGIGDIEKYINELMRAEGTSERMAKKMNDTLAGDVRGLGSAFESVQITIGKLFIPAMRMVVQAVTAVVRWFDKFSNSPLGKTIIKFAAAFSTFLVAATAFVAALWAISSVGRMLATKVFTPLKLALLGLSTPMLVLIGIAGALFLAFKSNFGGIGDYITTFWNKTVIAIKGVIAVFKNLKDGNAEIKGELATQIKANGLVGFVQTVSRIVARIMDVFSGFKKALGEAMSGVDDALFPIRLAVAETMQAFSKLFGCFKGDEITSSRSSWQSFGEVLGKIAGGVLTGFAQALAGVAKFLSLVIDFVSWVCGGIIQLGKNIMQATGLCRTFSESAKPDSWVHLGKVLGLLGVTMAGLKAATLAWKGVMVVVTAVTKAWAVAQRVLNVVMRANPIGIVITLCMALAAAAMWVWQNWDKVSAWWNALWTAVGEKCRAVWEAIKGWIAGAINSIVSAIVNFCSDVKAKAVAVWTGITTAIEDAWNGIVSGVIGFKDNMLAAITGAWNSVKESALATWESLKSGAIDAWNGIVESVSGLGARLLGAIQSAWNEVTSFFDGLSLFESGAKLLSTFIEGIKSMAGGLVDSVKGALAKVRSFLPFSDAKEGPLSTLTLSGSRMMTTLAEGVNQGKNALTASVSGALGEASKKLQGADMSLPDIGVPKQPDINVPGKDVMSTLGRALAFSVPKLEIPEIESPALKIPDAPAVAPEDTVSERGHQEGKESQSKGQSVSIVIHNLNLPDVADAAGFAQKLQSLFQSEIGALEGA